MKKYIQESGIITCDQLKKKVAVSTETPSMVAKAIGKDVNWLRGVFAGRYMMMASSLAKLCRHYRCGPDELVEFHGYEIDPRYEGYRYEPPEDGTGELTFEPLRSLFYDTYTERGEDWKKKLGDFFDTVKNSTANSMTERQVESIKKMREERERKRETEGTVIHPGKQGVTARKRASFSMDRDMKIISVYDVCRALRCPVGRVLGYK